MRTTRRVLTLRTRISGKMPFTSTFPCTNWWQLRSLEIALGPLLLACTARSILRKDMRMRIKRYAIALLDSCLDRRLVRGRLCPIMYETRPAKNLAVTQAKANSMTPANLASTWKSQFTAIGFLDGPTVLQTRPGFTLCSVPPELAIFARLASQSFGVSSTCLRDPLGTFRSWRLIDAVRSWRLRLLQLLRRNLCTRSNHVLSAS